MNLPEQFQAEELETRLDNTLEQLQENTLPEAVISAEVAQGGKQRSSARGAIVAKPTSEQAASLPFFSRTIKLAYEGLPTGEVVADTSPARLIKVGQSWRVQGLEGPWRTHHVFNLGPRDNELVYHVPRGEPLVAGPPQPKDRPIQPRARYEIPPSATRIQGQGVVKLRTGQSYEVDGERILDRPLANGELGIRPRGVYGVFESQLSTHEHHPKALIGNKWTRLTPIDETE